MEDSSERHGGRDEDHEALPPSAVLLKLYNHGREEIDMRPTIVVCAHRGASGTFPENTLAAFREAADVGSDMLEFDVRMAADGECVLLHDPTVDRTTDRTGNVWELTLEEVKRLDAGVKFGQQFVGERIPTLTETLNLVGGKVELNLHVYPGPNDGEALVRRVCEEIKERDLYQSSFIAGMEDVMQIARSCNPEVRRCNLHGQDSAANYLAACIEFGCYCMQPSNQIVTPGLCFAAHRAGMRVHPFYADDEAEMVRLIHCGVDGILTNYPARLIAVLH
ncbi:MAG: hypothetical protein HY318_08360, partial [Armatimonadetes bacterium]|nr:hypothetical protein [Armatimonadota bacterium]